MPAFRITLWSIVITMALLGVGVILARPHPSPGPPLQLAISHSKDVPALRNRENELLLFNFRVVEPGVLYRSSGFPRNRKDAKSQTRHAAAYSDGQAFQFMRARNIKTVVSLQEIDDFYGEEGYYDYWSKRTGYQIKVISLPIKPKYAYARDSNGSLAAASRFLAMMKERRADDGAVLVHGAAGKDRTGVVVAVYELWRNTGKMDSEKLWQQVRRRYLASNDLLARDKEVSSFAGGRADCPAGDELKKGYVCPGWLDKLRSDLELLAQL